MSYAAVGGVAENVVEACFSPRVAVPAAIGTTYWFLVNPILGIGYAYSVTFGCAYAWCSQSEQCQRDVLDYGKRFSTSSMVNGFSASSMSDDQKLDMVKVIVSKYEAAVAEARPEEVTPVSFQPPSPSSLPEPADVGSSNTAYWVAAGFAAVAVATFFLSERAK